MNIVDAIKNKDIFLPFFDDDLTTWQNWFVLLKAIFGLEMDEKELEVYKQFTGRTDTPSQPFREAFILSGRRSGKTKISAVIAVWMAVFKKWPKGQRGTIVCLAKDKSQAGECFDYISEIFKLPTFRPLVRRELQDVIELHSGIRIVVKTCSYASIRGYQILCVCADETSFWYVEGANPAVETFRAIRPSLGSLKNTLLLCITSIHSKRGIIYDTYKKYYGKDGAKTLVWKSTTSEMNPSYDQEFIADQLVEDRDSARAEYFSIWRDDLEGFFTQKEVEAVIVKGRESLPPVKDVQYFGFVDVSGAVEGGESMTMAIGHKEDGMIIQDRLVCQKAPYNASRTVKYFVDVFKEYNIHEIEGDQYGGHWPKQEFEKHPMIYEISKLSKAKLFMEAKPLFSSQRIQILDNKLQTNELLNLERNTTQTTIQIGHPRGGSDDSANSLCGMLALINRTIVLRTPAPSRGLFEDTPQTEKEKLDRDAINWLLNIKKKKRKDEIDLEELEREMMEGLEKEIAEELRNKDDAGVVFKRG